MAANPVAPNPPRTLRARLLLGWVPHDQAIRFLMNDVCFDPPITDADAERIWREYHDRTAALQERQIAVPERLPLSHQERQHAQRFLGYMRTLGPTPITDVIKIDLSKTVIHQLAVVTERADSYANRVRGNSWLHECLPTSQPAPVQINATVNMNGPNTSAVIQIPHGECALFPVQVPDTPQYPGFFGFNIQQFQRYVSVVDVGDRLMLKAGYHRTFARVLSMLPTAIVPTAVVALERNVTGPAVNQVAGVGEMVGDADFSPFGRRAAFFADFFTDGLFMDVNLRRKRYQLQIESKWIALDDSV